MKITRKILSLTLASITLLACLFCLSTQTVHAANLIGPPPDTSITSIAVKGNSVVVQWKAISTVDRYILQYSTDPGFTINTKSITVSGGNKSSYTFANTLYPDTSYYFRIKTIDDSLIIDESDWSVTKKYSYSVPYVQIEKISISDSEVNLSWGSPTLTINGYEVEYSPSISFSTNVKKFKITSQSQMNLTFANELTPGVRYYFRVRSFKTVNGKNFTSAWSTSRNAIYSLYTPTNVIAQVRDNGLTIHWTKKSNVSHLVQISDNPTFDNIIFTTQATTNAITINKGLVSGQSYYVRVCASLRGHVSPWSETHKFSYNMMPSSIKATVNGQSATFNFAYASQVTGSVVEYSTSSTFTQDVKKINLTGNLSSTTVNNLKPGVYYARIQAQNKINTIDGKTYTNVAPWSSVVTFTIMPKATSINSMSVSDQRIVLQWDVTGSCSGYEVQYSTSSEFKESKTIKVNGGTTNYLEIKNNLVPAQKYYIRIRVVASAGATLYSDWSSTRAFSYKLRNTYIKTLSVVDNTIKANWQTYDVYDGYEIQYTQNSTFADSKTINVPGWKIDSCVINENLIPGLQHVRIRGYRCVDGKTYYSDWSNVKTISYKLTKTYIKNMYQANGGIKINWLAINGCSGYEIQYSANSDMSKSKTINVAGSSTSTAQLNNITPGACYVRIRTFKTVNGKNYYSDWSNIKSIVCKLDKTYLTNLYISNNKAFIHWKPIDGCSGYQIQYTQSSTFANAKTVDIAGGNTEKCSGISLKPGTNYLRIRTYKTIDGVKYYSDWSNVKSLVFKVNETSIKTVENQYNKISVRWAMRSDCQGYELQYSTNQSFSENIGSVTIDKYNVVGYTFSPTPGKYHFRIRTYVVIDGIKYYSNWSSGMYIDFKITNVEIINASNDGTCTTISWTASKGAHGYQIQTSPYKTFESNIKTINIGNTNTTTYSAKEIPSSAITYVRVRAYKIIDGQKYYSDWSDLHAIYIMN